MSTGEQLPYMEESIKTLTQALKSLGLSKDQVEQLLAEILSRIPSTGGNEEKPKQRELPPSIVKYCEGFVGDMEGISKKQKMVELFKQLYRDGKLHIDENNLGKFVRIDGLGYEFLVLDLGKYNNREHPLYGINTKRKVYSSDFLNECHDETNIKGQETILKDNNLGYFLPSEEDMKKILERLKLQYSDVIKNIQEESGFHDEDIAFFMLLTQTYGEFRLRDGKVLKCYDKFRGFKGAKQGGTAQVLLIRKVK